jgi:hypothetical protein
VWSATFKTSRKKYRKFKKAGELGLMDRMAGKRRGIECRKEDLKREMMT